MYCMYCHLGKRCVLVSSWSSGNYRFDKSMLKAWDYSVAGVFAIMSEKKRTLSKTIQVFPIGVPFKTVLKQK